MTTSYHARHRPICEVIQDIRERAELINAPEIIAWCDEAHGYARRMSAKLEEHKRKEEGL